jgi:hypothetical protein
MKKKKLAGVASGAAFDNSRISQVTFGGSLLHSRMVEGAYRGICY